MAHADKPAATSPSRISTTLTHFRYRLAHTDALPQLALLGLVSGLATGLVAVAFRFAIEWPLALFLPSKNSEGFESLPIEARLALPLIGMIFIALLMWGRTESQRQCGVAHVIRRYQQHQGHLPASNGILQFIGGSIAVLSGYSVGREGPAVHLGAACSSLLGQKFGLPNNSLRIMVGCGVAGAISASFNTPLAGVIFAMEVVLMEYTVAGFIPIILASVSATVVSRIFFGDAPAFEIPPLTMASLLELPFLVFCGIVIGLASTLVLKLHQFIQTLQSKTLISRLIAAGLLTSLTGAFIPQVMGLGYDTVEAAMLGTMSLNLLLIVVIAKLLLSTITIALGIPGGSIGPTLVVGACLGGALGIIGASFSPENSASSGFYATVGMAAMMAGVLNAPLAALMTLVELTHNPAIVLPAMLVIVIACITARMSTHLPGLFLVGNNPAHFTSPLSQSLSRAGVTSLMSQSFISHSPLLPANQAGKLLEQHPDWIIIETDDKKTQENVKFILHPSDLARHMQTIEADDSLTSTEINLLEIPGQRWHLHPIQAQATLQEAHTLLRQKDGFAVGVLPQVSTSNAEFIGIVTQDKINNYYQ